ncbi:MAG: ankyrin repeat domain-containing protein [Armatimonadetes bacterium]|nr:ankyrin repeat domain-containing protein [Armatimonadota bacterium]
MSDGLDGLFREALAAVDAGDLSALAALLAAHPELACERLEAPGEWLRESIGGALDGFMARPYLLWFVSEDAPRAGKLPANIADLARAIIAAARRAGAADLQEQLDYGLRLVAWSPTARECGVQLELVDALVEAGAVPDVANDALVNGNFAAAERLIEHGGKLTLASSACLGRWDAFERLGAEATAEQKQFALVLAALNGRGEAVRRLLALGADAQAPSEHLYSHGTPLHHAVWSGDLATVKVLVEAGAALDATDTAFGRTPLGWAEYAQSTEKDPERVERYVEIAAHLRERGAPG